MKIKERRLRGVFEIVSSPHVDFRGFLARTYEQEMLKALGVDWECVEESLSHTNLVRTVRGLHVQLPPFSEGKLISIIRGKMRWVVVDLRRGSETFGQWDSVLLCDTQYNALYVERGFAHGCLSLSDDCDLILKADQKFASDHGAGIIWNDATLGIDWELGNASPLISERDSNYPSFESFLKTYLG